MASSSLPNTVMLKILNLKTFYFLTYCDNKTFLTFAVNRTIFIPNLFDNMNFRKNLLTSHVKGKDIVLDTKTFSSLCCGIPIQGSKHNRFRPRFGETIKNKDILSIGYLKLEERLLHYFLSYVILPKLSNHSQISDIELQLMYAIQYNININWALMIMRKMWNVRGSQSPLPYAIFITKILDHFGGSLHGETKVALNLRESKIDVEVCHKMGFSIDPIDRGTYRHQTDRPTAPTTQPETTIPNPPEFHAQSSSSAAMPSNQMIMDELVSLRAYITTRMDALDTRNDRNLLVGAPQARLLDKLQEVRHKEGYLLRTMVLGSTKKLRRENSLS
ncbi:hypothetical protein Lal_00000923 [Lupinus albus]|nr:hypothetical protein Lal_00000923 [Lupinus albus]